MQLLDVRPDHLRLVQEILRKHVPEAEVWVFGSRAKWLARDTSDLDLCIRGDVPLSFEKMGALREAFEESDLPWKVDVVDWATTSESFRKIIDRDKVEVQGSGAFGCGAELITRPLEECLEALIDYRGKTPKKADAGIPLITAKVVKSGRIERPDEFIAEDTYEAWMTRGYPEVGDVVLTTEAPLGEVAQIKFLPVALAQRVVTLRGKKEILDNGYLLYLLQTAKMQEKLIGRSSGTTVLGIKQSELRKIEVTLPPVKEQRAIARILGALDDKIDVNRRLNGTQETMARALFKAWFVDFDGVPSGDMWESELGMIPRGWKVGTLADLCDLNAAKWTDKKHPSTVRYVDLSGVSENRISVVTEYTFDEAPSRARLPLREGDTIVGTVRPGNRAFAYIHSPEVNLTGSTGFAVLSPKLPHYASFIYLAATCDEAIDRLARLADGAAYPAVRPNVVAGTPSVIAPDEVLAEFSALTRPMLEHIGQNNQQASTLAVLRDELLPRLISGRLRVSPHTEV